jgi:hypothetical protein
MREWGVRGHVGGTGTGTQFRIGAARPVVGGVGLGDVDGNARGGSRGYDLRGRRGIAERIHRDTSRISSVDTIILLPLIPHRRPPKTNPPVINTRTLRTPRVFPLAMQLLDHET